MGERETHGLILIFMWVPYLNGLIRKKYELVWYLWKNHLQNCKILHKYFLIKISDELLINIGSKPEFQLIVIL